MLILNLTFLVSHSPRRSFFNACPGRRRLSRDPRENASRLSCYDSCSSIEDFLFVSLSTLAATLIVGWEFHGGFGLQPPLSVAGLHVRLD
jgi:hypothetical protein